jgi:predicted nucleic acid-binding protein
LNRRLAVVEIDAGVCQHAAQLAKTHALRGYDSVQLACSLKAHQLLLQSSGIGVTFLTADKTLLRAGKAEGMLADDPNQH